VACFSQRRLATCLCSSFCAGTAARGTIACTRLQLYAANWLCCSGRMPTAAARHSQIMSRDATG